MTVASLSASTSSRIATQTPVPDGADPSPQAQPQASSPPHWRPALQALGDRFYATVRPTPLPSPAWVARSHALARELGLEEEWLRSNEALQVCSGNLLPPGAHPMASVYSGHQFGHWAGQLGDGRALLLGEIDTPQGPQEIQLKGAGLTPFSRMGDGRAVLRSSIREFLCSEAMHALGIPTTRALCITGSPQPVRRETVETAAVVTRSAPSFLRFGHFEHFSHSGQHIELRRLADHVIERFYPELLDTPTVQPANRYAALLQAMSERTARLVAQWQAVGFCHGVMNTDNMSILGLTLDYGPFQFMDGFDPAHICNHTDTSGRYAYNRQPQVAYWNLFCLAQALLPLMDDTDQAMQALEPYKTLFPQALHTAMAAKLGFRAGSDGHQQTAVQGLLDALLGLMGKERVDYTLFWWRLTQWAQQTHAQSTPDSAQAEQALAACRDLFIDRSALDPWFDQYSELQNQYGHAIDAILMKQSNPKFVLRNHVAQEVIEQAQRANPLGVSELLTVLQSPGDEHPAHEAWAALPPEWAASITVSCSS